MFFNLGSNNLLMQIPNSIIQDPKDFCIAPLKSLHDQGKLHEKNNHATPKYMGPPNILENTKTLGYIM